LHTDSSARGGRFPVRAGCGLALAVLLASGAAAQQPEPPESGARRDIQGGREAGREAERAREIAPFEGPRVDYADVLRDPDDVDLNYRFAQTQVRDGDLRGAASTLERILLRNPGLAQVRLLYAIVLYRLDSVYESEREFRVLEGMVLPEDVRREVERYRRDLTRRKERTRYSANLTFGGQYDTNRDAAPAGKQRLFFDIPATSAAGKPDSAALVIGSIRMTHDLGTPEGHEVFAVATGYGNWQNRLTQFNLLAGGMETGFTLRGDAVDVIPSVLAGYAELDQSRLLRFGGGRVRIERQQGEDLALFADGLLQYQDYDDINETHDGTAIAPTASQLTGMRFDGELGLTWTITPEQRLTAAYLRISKWADADFNAYDGDAGVLRHTWLLGAGQFLVSQAIYEIDVYDAPDPFVSSRTRRDQIFRARLTYGAPISTLLGAVSSWTLPESLADLTMLAVGEYVYSDSNIENYTYDNWRGQLLLSKTWTF
jgi:hypothetical protein